MTKKLNIQESFYLNYFVGYHYIELILNISHDNNASEYMKDYIFELQRKI